MNKYDYLILDLTRPLKIDGDKITIRTFDKSHIVDLLVTLGQSKYLILNNDKLRVTILIDNIKDLDFNMWNKSITFRVEED